MKNASIHWMIGGSVSTLINHDIKAVLHGFTKKEQNVFVLKDQKDDPSRININFQSSLRLETQLFDKNSFIFVQPGICAPLFSANSGKERHHLYSLFCEVGFIIKPKSQRQEQ